MCKCEIRKCVHAENKLLDGKIRCSVRGETVALKRYPDYVPFVVTKENIKNKFPEINHFIEKPKDYELLYYQGDKIHNEYPLEVEEAKAIFNYIDYLENEQKEFISWLEDKMNELLKEYGNYVHDDYSEEKGKYDTYIEVLQKYKEIIEDKADLAEKVESDE